MIIRPPAHKQSIIVQQRSPKRKLYKSNVIAVRCLHFMTKREEKHQRKKAQFQEAERVRLKKAKTKKLIFRIIQVLSIVCCIGFLCGGLLLSDKAQLLCFLGCFWMWAITAFASWRLNPSGTSVSVRQVGKSGLLQTVNNKNSTVFFTALAVAVLLSIIIIPL